MSISGKWEPNHIFLCCEVAKLLLQRVAQWCDVDFSPLILTRALAVFVYSVSLCFGGDYLNYMEVDLEF